MNLNALDLTILGPAMLAGLLVLATHVPLGVQVLARGIVFIDLAIAQTAGFGVIAADLMGWESHGWEVQFSAVGTALLAALLLTWTEKRWREAQEALIGALFVLAATGGILLLAHNPHGGEHLKDLLVGQILWVNYTQLFPVALLTAAVLALWYGWREKIGNSGFYLLFAVSVTASVQLVGVYLVFASLIIPALATRYSSSTRFRAGYGVGAAGYAGGLLVSAWFDLPSGAVIVWVMAFLGMIYYAATGFMLRGAEDKR